MESTKYTCKHGTTNLLNSKNYHSWKNALTIYLRSENALQIVLGNEQPPPGNSTFHVRQSYQKRFGSALSMLYSSCEQSLRDVIDELPDQHPAQIWVLNQRCNTAAFASSRFATRRVFVLTTMKEGTSVADYISTLKGLQQQLAGTEQAISDIDLVTHLLATLAGAFDNFVEIATQQMDVDGVSGRPTIESITSRLAGHGNSLATRNARVGAAASAAGTLTSGNALAAGFIDAMDVVDVAGIVDCYPIPTIEKPSQTRSATIA